VEIYLRSPIRQRQICLYFLYKMEDLVILMSACCVFCKVLTEFKRVQNKIRLYVCCASLLFNWYYVCISAGTWTIQIFSPFPSVLPGKFRIITQLHTDQFVPCPFQSNVHQPPLFLTPSSLIFWQCCRNTKKLLKRNRQSKDGTST